jgi:uncharacterized protein (DUF2344 family)
MKDTQNKKTKLLHVRITEQLYKYLLKKSAEATITLMRPVSFSDVVRKTLSEKEFGETAEILSNKKVMHDIKLGLK